jgi:hypothetical protein
MEHPIFLSIEIASLSRLTESHPAQSEVADTRANVPGGRVRRVVRRDARHPTPRAKGGIHMAKKAKGGKKKAAKKR